MNNYFHFDVWCAREMRAFVAVLLLWHDVAKYRASIRFELYRTSSFSAVPRPRNKQSALNRLLPSETSPRDNDRLCVIAISKNIGFVVNPFLLHCAKQWIANISWIFMSLRCSISEFKIAEKHLSGAFVLDPLIAGDISLKRGWHCWHINLNSLSSDLQGWGRD